MSLFAELDTQRARADALRKRLAWAYVSEAEDKLGPAEEQVAKCKEKQVKVEKFIAERDEKLKEAQADKSEKTKAMADFNAASAATVDERKAAATEAHRARKAADEVRRQVSTTQQERTELQRKAARLTEARETARQTQQRETQAETSAADAAVARARRAFEECKQAHERVKAEEAAASRAAEEARARCYELSNSDDDLLREEREARDGLRRLQSTQSDSLAAFGDKMPALVRGATPCVCLQHFSLVSNPRFPLRSRQRERPPVQRAAHRPAGCPPAPV
jgi:chromosome segregation ATPase